MEYFDAVVPLGCIAKVAKNTEWPGREDADFDKRRPVKRSRLLRAHSKPSLLRLPIADHT